MNLVILLGSFLVSFVLLIIAMTAHEFAHGLMAYKLGDSTAKFSGRLTLNPLAHIDPVWTLLMPLLLYIGTQGQFVFGAAKPVPINFWALKNPKRDVVLIGLSGPFANFVFAYLLSMVLKAGILPQGIIYSLLKNLIVINVVLGAFNLIPIPPLDGSRVLSGLLPDNLSYQYSRLEPYAFVILAALMWTGILNVILWPVVNTILMFLGIRY